MKRQSLFRTVESRFAKLLLLLCLLITLNSYGNSLTVSNVTYNLSLSTVTFDLLWNNGWRNTGSAPNNWDAAWVFVKFRDCFTANSIPFTHGLVSTAVSDHTFNGTGGGGSSTYEPTDRYGNANTIDASPN